MSKRYDETRKRELVISQAASGLQQKDFCKIEGVPVKTFQKWKSKFGQFGENNFIELTRESKPEYREVEIVFFDGTTMRLRG